MRTAFFLPSTNLGPATTDAPTPAAVQLYRHVKPELDGLIERGAERVESEALSAVDAVRLMRADVARAMQIVQPLAAEKREVVMIWALRYFDRVTATAGLPACLRPTRRRIFFDEVQVIHDAFADVLPAADAPGLVASFQPLGS